jgi:type III secretory pathway component EscT
VSRNLEGAIGLAAVMVLCLFTAELTLGLISRSVRQFQVFELSMAFKNLFFAFLMPLLVVALLAAMTRELGKIPQLLDWLKQLRP